MLRHGFTGIKFDFAVKETLKENRGSMLKTKSSSTCAHTTPLDCTVQVWDISGEDHSSQDLAMDKRAAIERRLREEDEAQGDEITK